jgi:hypothetical protein
VLYILTAASRKKLCNSVSCAETFRRQISSIAALKHVKMTPAALLADDITQK